MAAEVTRKTVISIMEESTSGVPISPASGADYIPVRAGFDLSPSVENIDNDELSPSVATKAPILGNENPTAEIPVYLRHSGTEAVAPSIDKLLKGAFGDKVAAPAESLTAAASTAGTSSAAAIIKLASGGSNYPRGSALLIKDGVNGYSVRNSHSVATNDVTLGFNLAGAAPGAGIGVGRPILYKPADTLPSLAMTCFRGNGGLKEIISGLRVSEMSIEANAGQPLTANFSLAGIKYFFNPIEITASTDTIDFEDDGGPVTATLAAKFYKDPHDAASGLSVAMTAASVGSGDQVVTVRYSDTTGKFTTAATGTTFDVDWATTANTLGAKFGYTADDSGATSYVSDLAIVLASPYTPTSDTNINPLICKDSEVLMGTFSDYGLARVQNFTATLSNELEDILELGPETAVAEKLLVQRSAAINTVLTLQRNDAGKFLAFRRGDDIRFGYNVGEKSGGNWVSGRIFNLYMPQCKVSSFKVSGDTVVTIEMTLNPYGGSDGLGEVYAGLV